MGKQNDSGPRLQDLRQALLYRLVEMLENSEGYAGKIQLQKLVYFLQERFGISTKYSFRMHHYGPYSEDLDTDLTWLRLMGYVTVTPDPEGYGFHITRADEPESTWEGLVFPYSEEITRVMDLFQGRPASELELAATIHFVQQLLEEPSPEQVREVVGRLKPKFSGRGIEAMYQELQAEGFL